MHPATEGVLLDALLGELRGELLVLNASAGDQGPHHKRSIHGSGRR